MDRQLTTVESSFQSWSRQSGYFKGIIIIIIIIKRTENEGLMTRSTDTVAVTHY